MSLSDDDKKRMSKRARVLHSILLKVLNTDDLLVRHSRVTRVADMIADELDVNNNGQRALDIAHALTREMYRLCKRDGDPTGVVVFGALAMFVVQVLDNVALGVEKAHEATSTIDTSKRMEDIPPDAELMERADLIMVLALVAVHTSEIVDFTEQDDAEHGT